MNREPLMRAGLWVLRQIARLPDRWVRRLGLLLGELLWWVALPRRRIALTNLALCFPAMAEHERRRLARRHFHCFGAGFLECFVFWHEPAERIVAMVRQRGREHFDAHAGRPLIVFAPHFVGLDAGGLRMLVDSPGASMFANQKSRALTETMTRGRSRFGSRGMFVRNDGMRPVMRTVAVPAVAASIVTRTVRRFAVALAIVVCLLNDRRRARRRGSEPDYDAFDDDEASPLAGA